MFGDLSHITEGSFEIPKIGGAQIGMLLSAPATISLGLHSWSHGEPGILMEDLMEPCKECH